MRRGAMAAKVQASAQAVDVGMSGVIAAKAGEEGRAGEGPLRVLGGPSADSRDQPIVRGELMRFRTHRERRCQHAEGEQEEH